MTATDLAVAVIIAFAAAVQSVSGFGFSLLAVPLLSSVIDPKVAVMLTAATGLPLTLSIAFSERRKVVGRLVAVLTAAAFAGMPLGLGILGWIDARVLEGSIAVLVIALTVLLARGFSVEAEAGEGGSWDLSGAKAVSCHAGGLAAPGRSQRTQQRRVTWLSCRCRDAGR